MGLAPAAPEAGLSIGLILLAIACVFLLALNKMWKFTIGALLSTLASMFNSLSFHVPVINKHIGLGFIGTALADVDSYVLEAIGVGIQETEKGLHAVLGAMTWLMQETADQVAGLAEDTWKGLQSIKKYAIPAALGVAIPPLWKEIQHIAGQTKTIILHPTTIVHKTTQVIAPGFKALEGKVKTLEAQVASIGAVAPTINITKTATNVITRPLSIPGDIYRGIDDLRHRINKALRTLTPAGLLGLVAAAVGTMGMHWTRCAKSKKFGKSVCGMNDDLLDALIAGALVVGSTISIVELAKECQTFTDDVTIPLRLFVRELKSAKLPGAPSFVGQLQKYASGNY